MRHEQRDRRSAASHHNTPHDDTPETVTSLLHYHSEQRLLVVGGSEVKPLTRTERTANKKKTMSEGFGSNVSAKS